MPILRIATLDDEGLMCMKGTAKRRFRRGRASRLDAIRDRHIHTATVTRKGGNYDNEERLRHALLHPIQDRLHVLVHQRNASNSVVNAHSIQAHTTTA